MKSPLITQVLNNKQSRAEELYRIAEDAYEHQSPWTIEQFISILDQPFIIVVIALQDDRIIGFLIGRALSMEAEIYNIAVDKNYQQQGVGTNLMTEFKRNLCVNHIQDVFLEVRKSNLNAQSFYKKHGFDLVGVRKAYYSNPTEDAIVLKFSK